MKPMRVWLFLLVSGFYFLSFIQAHAAIVATVHTYQAGTGTTSALNSVGSNLCVVTMNGFGSPTLSDNQGNTYTLAVGYTGPFYFARIYYSYVATTNASHTWSVSGGSLRGIAVQCFSGANPSASPAVEMSSNFPNVVGTTVQPGSLTSAVNGSLYVSALSSSGTGAVSVGSGLTISDQSPTVGGQVYAYALGYLIQSTAAALNPTWTVPGTWGSNPIAIQAVFVSGSGGGGGGGSSAVCGGPSLPSCTTFITNFGDYLDLTGFTGSAGFTQVMSELTATQNSISSFTCGNGSNISGKIGSALSVISTVGGIIGGLFGGGAEVAVLIKILTDTHQQIQNQLQQICELTQGNAILTTINDFLSNPNAISSIVITAAMKDPTTAGLVNTYSSSVGSFAVGTDDTVTAVNKANVLAVANTQALMASMDRLIGPAQQPYQQLGSGNALLGQAEIDASRGVGQFAPDGGIQAEFGEGDYQGTRDKIASAAGSVALKGNRFEDVDASEAEETGSCLQPVDADPATDDWKGSVTRLKWNARQKLAASDAGKFICKIVDHPDVTPTEICPAFNPGSALMTNVMPTTTKLCIYGPDAPPALDFIWAALPILTMIGASLGGLRFFI